MSAVRRRSTLVTLLAGLACGHGAPAAGASPRSFEARVVEAVSERKILPDGRLPRPIAPEVRIQLCPGEYEPASFVLAATGEGLSDVLATATPLRAAKGRISAESVDIKIVQVWYQAATAWRLPRQPKLRSSVLVPELLLHDPEMVRPNLSLERNLLRLRVPEGSRYVPDGILAASRGRLTPPVQSFPLEDSAELEPAQISGGHQQQFWVTVHAPVDQPAGLYRGSIRIDSARQPLTQIPLIAEILPFALADPDLTYSIYYRAKLAPANPTVSSEGKSREQLRAELTDMIQHGITNPTIYQPWPKPADPPPVRAAKIALVREYLRIRQQLGLSGQPIYYLGRHAESGNRPRQLARLAADVQEIQDLAAGFDVPEVFLYGADEARGPRLRAQEAAWRRVHAQGAKVFAAGYVGHTREIGGLTDLLVLHGDPNRDEAKQQHRFGNRIFSYANPQSGPENPVLFRKNYGVRLWQAGFDGAMIYAYQDSMGSIWNDFDHEKWRDHTLAYPTIRKPIATLAWEGLREAVDDVRYIRTLESAIQSAGGSTEGEKATRFLGRLRRQKEFDPNEVRSRIIQHLRRLTAASTGNPPS